jgi:hypothetical protein
MSIACHPLCLSLICQLSIKDLSLVKNTSTSSLPSFLTPPPRPQVEVIDGVVHVVADSPSLKINQHPPLLCPHNPSNSVTVVVVGGGPAAMCAVETLRSHHFDGAIVVLSDESTPPYDRTKLSKRLAGDVASITLRPLEYFEKNGIEVI